MWAGGVGENAPDALDRRRSLRTLLLIVLLMRAPSHDVSESPANASVSGEAQGLALAAR